MLELSEVFFYICVLLLWLFCYRVILCFLEVWLLVCLVVYWLNCCNSIMILCMNVYWDWVSFLLELVVMIGKRLGLFVSVLLIWRIRWIFWKKNFVLICWKVCFCWCCVLICWSWWVFRIKWLIRLRILLVWCWVGRWLFLSLLLRLWMFICKVLLRFLFRFRKWLMNWMSWWRLVLVVVRFSWLRSWLKIWIGWNGLMMSSRFKFVCSCLSWNLSCCWWMWFFCIKLLSGLVIWLIVFKKWVVVCSYCWFGNLF